LLNVINTLQFSDLGPSKYLGITMNVHSSSQLELLLKNVACISYNSGVVLYRCEWLYNETENFCFMLQIPNLTAKRWDTYEMIHADGRRDASIALIS